MPCIPPENGQVEDQSWAARAIELARRAEYRTSPNPMVGAVVLDGDGRLAGEGYHRGPGRPHAEEEALAAAGPRARGGTIYVNLEPCTHAHRHPCCVDAVIASGVRRAVVSMTDPDPRVRGNGIRALKAAGVDTIMGVADESAVRLNEFYIKHRLTGRPFVAAKFAVTLDGKIATRSGESRWITNLPARRHAHGLRQIYDAVLVGVDTVLIDDPELTTRLDRADARQPMRIVVDSQLRTPLTARVVGMNTLIATTRAGEVGPAEVIHLPATEDGRVSLPALLDELGKRRILSVLVEGGGTIHASFFGEDLVDKVYAYIAPRLIGGRDAPGPVGGAGIEHLSDAIGLHGVDVTRLGDDVLITAYADVHRNR
ncbi:MAG: bifunctional diaminohydroxyphosphoribosylaminopyrimidine deaminase/5-amino-6-(5-phosphoribosylamino)uracil reductase RibD [Candidatus Dormibacterales bacterium]